MKTNIEHLRSWLGSPEEYFPIERVVKKIQPNDIFQCEKCYQRFEYKDMVHIGKFGSIATYLSYDLGGRFCFSCASENINTFNQNHPVVICQLCGMTFRVMAYCGETRHLNNVCKKCLTPRIKRERSKIANAKFRAERLGLLSSITLVEWLSTLDRYKSKCAYCGADYEEIHHFIPISKGGGSTAENLIPACRRCNHTKKNNIWEIHNNGDRL